MVGPTTIRALIEELEQWERDGATDVVLKRDSYIVRIGRLQAILAFDVKAVMIVPDFEPVTDA